MEKEEHTVLWNSLSELDRNNVEKNAHYYLAGYDAPFKLLFRRNEIWMILKNNGEENKKWITFKSIFFLNAKYILSFYKYGIFYKHLHISQILL